MDNMNTGSSENNDHTINNRVNADINGGIAGGVNVVQTDVGAKDGQTKCPKCGATDISTNTKTGKLRCNFCRFEFEPEQIDFVNREIEDLQGITIGSGAQNIAEDTGDVVTLKCSSCGAEVVIDTQSSNQARCHWCRNTLSLNQQIPNGAVPDTILPFAVTRDEARAEIEKFVNRRKFFAHPTFTKEFTTENVNGVYFPYMIVDINAHTRLSGTGEHQTREYTVGSGDDKKTYYDADAFHVEREFDIAIDNLTLESSAERLDVSAKNKTNNIINSIMPFDVEHCVKYDSNYLKGYTSEKRDTNIEQLKPIVDTQAQDIARIAANDTLEQYDRGVEWEDEQFQVKGEAWSAAYLPVWLYSYMQQKGGKQLLHYVAVNARTKETMGSVPINMIKLFVTSLIIELFGGFLLLLMNIGFIDIDSDYKWLLLLPGIVFFGIMYMRYRNSDARHTYEAETKRTLSNLRKVDSFLESRKRLRRSTMEGANNTELRGNLNNLRSDAILSTLQKQGVSPEFLRDQANRLGK